MSRVAEEIVRNAVEKVLEQHNASYAICDTAKGFSVHLLNRPVTYFFSYYPRKGWKMDRVVRKTKKSAEQTSVQQDLSSVLEHYNVRYVLYKNKPKDPIAEQMREIDAFFYPYRELLKSRHVKGNELTYTFHPIDSHQPAIHVVYNEEHSCWMMLYSDFNQGENMLPSLEKIYRNSQKLLFELNKINN